MSEHMKKHHTNNDSKQILFIVDHDTYYAIPKNIAEKYAETRASVLRVFKREIRAMNPNDSFKMIKDVLQRISTRDKGAVSAGQRQVRDHIFEKYLMRVDNKMKRSDVYQKGKYEVEMCVEFLKASIDSDEKQIEYIIDLATTEGFLDDIAVGAVDVCC